MTAVPTDLFCPSRGRPEAAHELLASFERTRTTEDVRLVFLIDKDDPTADAYPNPCRVGQPTGDPTGPLNAAVRTSRADIVGFLGDDSRFETIGWDAMVQDALGDPGFCWGNDGHARPWPTTIFISRVITDALGWMVPPTLRRGFFDVAWTLLAERTGTARVIPAMFRHDNSKGDPASANYDPAYRVPPEVIASDERAFTAWRENDLKRDAQRLRRVLYLGERHA